MSASISPQTTDRTRYKPYPKYKESGVEWLGNIPAGWQVGRLKSMLSLSREKNGKERVGEMLSVSGYRGVELKEYDFEERKRSVDDLADYRVVRVGQLVANTMWLNYAGLGVSALEGYVSPAYRCYYIAHKYEPGYLHHLMRSAIYVGHYCGLLYGIRPNSLQIKNHDWDSLELLLPTRDEQRAIAAFLDRETAKIDALIAKKERLIELLQEKRTALIESTVAGQSGDSEVKLGHYVDLLSGYAFPSADFSHDPDDIRLLRGVNVAPGAIRWDDCVRWPKSDMARFSQYELLEDDLAFGMDRPWIGSGIRVARLTGTDIPSLLLQRVARLRARQGLLQKYLTIVLASPQFRAYFEPILTGISVPHVSPDQIRYFRFRLPEESVQNSACLRFGSETEKIDKMRDVLMTSITRLEEFRTALISAAVTGKIDVRGEVA